ncbi:MAG TPA: hypothetical protein VGT05_01750 [Patescibacteria group bacterium]|nr:hypothetical protein [Patescibacteria group bacterium]
MTEQLRSHLSPKPPSYYLEHEEGKSPVILLPGIIERWGFLRKIGDAVSQAGHAVYVVPSLGDNLHTIQDSARITREVIEKNNLNHVVLIAHSKGGLIGKYLLVHDNEDGRIDTLIAIATPFSGSPVAGVVPFTPFKELLPGSEVIRELQSHEEVNGQIVSIFPEFDNHIPSGSYLQGAENIRIHEKGHHKVLFHSEAVMQVLSLLQKSETK